VLHVGQPTITGQVQALESFYGVDLFHRRGRRVELTETGRELYAVTQRMEILEKEAQEVLQNAGGFKSGHLRIGAGWAFPCNGNASAFS
jgi:DNA-binding transcriptional LysR family regulator